MKKFTKFTRGFTLIELLVVIAIIGILSSIVLASLSTARSKANDSKVEEQMSGLRSAAEIYNSANNGYATGAVTTGTTPAACAALSGTLFSDTTSGAYNIIIGIASTTGVSTTGTGTSCVASSTAWALEVNLPSGGSGTNTSWCADSTGKSETQPYVAVSASQLCH